MTEIVRLLIRHDLFQTCISFPKTRAQDKNAATKLLLFEYNNKLVETKKASLDKFVKQAKKVPKETVELASRRVIDTLDRMAEIFLPRDPLLRSAGVFPVYYWFIRENDGKKDQYIREFLNSFEKSRKENQETASNQRTGIDADGELSTFDRFNRSTDDERSHLERYKIIEKRFKKYLSRL